jgi:type II secretory ATPase GspE/PulE/Tfp pilus assembly ATPase PilB-like protein
MPKPTLSDKLSEIHRREEETKAKNLAKKLNLPYLNLFGLPIEPDGLFLLTEEKSTQANLIIIKKQGKNLEIALVNPENPATKQVLDDLARQGFNFQDHIFLISGSSLKDGLEHYKEITLASAKQTGQIEISSGLISELQKEIKGIENLKEKINQIPESKTSEILEVIISGALNLDASDIHLEPKEETTNIKYRLDGLLYEIGSLKNKSFNLILSRIKLLSSMKLNIKNISQDGRFTIRLSQADIEVRVSLIPGNYGESIVMRLLNPETIGLNLEDLGFRKDALNLLDKEIKKPNGLIITTGPTGSGKTTTLYSFIKKVAKSELKIITLEDPVEYHLPGIVQTQIEEDAGYTFAAGLRSVLRQDPDIILIGEIRDTETCKTALNASLTGHLVFSTLHTNDAAGAIPRFIDLGADPGSLAASLNVIMAQRLIRRLCNKCKEKYEPAKEIVEKIKNALKGIEHPPIEKADFFRTKGCNECNGLGYKGRVGILELIPVDPDLEKIISKSPSHADIVDFAKKKGYLNMYQDALLRVLTGVTTIEEVERVIESE